MPVSNQTQADSIVINEIAWMGTAASANDEWIELYNPTGQSVSVDNWNLDSRDGTPAIALSGSIGADGYYVLKRTPNDVLPDVPTGKMYSGALSNSGEYLELKNASGAVVDAVDASGGWPAGENPSGNPQGRATMERVSSAVSGSDPSNWKTNNKAIRNGHDSSGNPVNGTPGAANSVRAF